MFSHSLILEQLIILPFERELYHRLRIKILQHYVFVQIEKERC